MTRGFLWTIGLLAAVLGGACTSTTSQTKDSSLQRTTLSLQKIS